MDGDIETGPIRPKRQTIRFETTETDSDENKTSASQPSSESALDRYLRRKTDKRQEAKLDPVDESNNNEPDLSHNSDQSHSASLLDTAPLLRKDASFFDETTPFLSLSSEPIRTDPVDVVKSRQRRLERKSIEKMPEYHCVGQIIGARGLTSDSTEGAYCRWKIEHGNAWTHIEGELLGQTQIAYNHFFSSEELAFNHPIDVHFAELGIQSSGSPRILVQCTKVDWHGRRILCGYGFTNIPSSSGYYKLEIPIWRPTGTLQDEMSSFFLGHNPALISPEPIFESAWSDRCRLTTVSSGTVVLELYIVSRHSIYHSFDQPSNVR